LPARRTLGPASRHPCRLCRAAADTSDGSPGIRSSPATRRTLGPASRHPCRLSRAAADTTDGSPRHREPCAPRGRLRRHPGFNSRGRHGCGATSRHACRRRRPTPDISDDSSPWLARGVDQESGTGGLPSIKSPETGDPADTRMFLVQESANGTGLRFPESGAFENRCGARKYPESGVRESVSADAAPRASDAAPCAPGNRMLRPAHPKTGCRDPRAPDAATPPLRTRTADGRNPASPGCRPRTP
jgi:hypothetical protein